MAACAHVILPILAGAEATVSTKTFLNTVVVLRLLAAALDADSADVPSPPAIFPADLAADVATAAGMAAVAEEVAARMADCVSLSLVGAAGPPPSLQATARSSSRSRWPCPAKPSAAGPSVTDRWRRLAPRLASSSWARRD